MAANYSSNYVKIDGLRELQASLKTAPPYIKKAFNREMQGVAVEVSNSVRAQMPSRSGNARRSVKPSFAQGYVAVRAGGATARYYPWLDFGGTLGPSGRRRNTQHRPFFQEGRWIYPTIARRRSAILARAAEIVDRWKRVTL